MRNFTFRLVLAVLITGLVCLSPIAIASTNADNSGSPTLGGARVTPENNLWGSTFTYEVTYTDNENNMPATGYPKVYIDGSPENMVEKDPTDNDVTDGKVYKYDWTTAKENVGAHSFYFYVETLTGENARNPATGTYVGPQVKKRYVSLSCKVDNPEPAAGETVTFSGYLRTEDNLGVESENMVLYKLLSDEDIYVSSATTDENGYFTLPLEIPDSGIFCYRVRFIGDNYYETSESSSLYVNTLDKPLVLGISAVILLALLGVLMFLFSRGIVRAHYLMPVLVGFGLGFLLVFMGAADLGILAGGAITGYLFAKRTREWTKHIRIGCVTGFLFILAFELIFVYFLTGSPELLGLRYSVTEMEVFKIFLMTIFYNLVYYSLLVGVGAAVGGMLRKLLKPREEKPLVVAG